MNSLSARTAKSTSPPKALFWLIPVGCFGIGLVTVGMVVGIFTLVMSLIKNNAVYEEAFETASNHPDVVGITGEPIEPGWFVTGSINTSGQTGEADLSIPISGPNGSGRVHVVATKNVGEWYTSRLVFLNGEGGPPIDLMPESSPDP